MLIDNIKIEALKANRIWDIYPTANQRNYCLLPLGMTLRPDEACAERIKGQCESDTSLDAEGLD